MIDQSGNAFPIVVIKKMQDATIIEQEITPGLTKREWFAGMALAGLLANPEISHVDRNTAASDAAAFADAMLAEGAK